MNSENRTHLIQYLIDLGADKIAHSQGNLLEHLRRTSNYVEKHGGSDAAVTAALFHSVYSTQVFKKILLDSQDRSPLKKLIGEESERLVYIFSVLDRESLWSWMNSKGIEPMKNRIDQKILLISRKESKEISLIALANEMDHLKTMSTEQIVSLQKTIENFNQISV